MRRANWSECDPVHSGTRSKKRPTNRPTELNFSVGSAERDVEKPREIQLWYGVATSSAAPTLAGIGYKKMRAALKSTAQVSGPNPGVVPSSVAQWARWA